MGGAQEGGLGLLAVSCLLYARNRKKEGEREKKRKGRKRKEKKEKNIENFWSLKNFREKNKRQFMKLVKYHVPQL
jgi:hypothetical protein